MSLAGKIVKIRKLGEHGRLAEVELPGDPVVTVQWGGDWLLVARDDPDSDEQHVVGFSEDQVRDLIPILQSFDKGSKDAGAPTVATEPTPLVSTAEVEAAKAYLDRAAEITGRDTMPATIIRCALEEAAMVRAGTYRK